MGYIGQGILLLILYSFERHLRNVCHSELIVLIKFFKLLGNMKLFWRLYLLLTRNSKKEKLFSVEHRKKTEFLKDYESSLKA